MEEEIIAAAKSARQLAYAPYSHFKVGAALLADDGQIFTGCNIENASYGLTNCAERTALFKAVSEGVRDFQLLVVCTDSPKLTAPCGACRQVLAEFAPNMPILLVNLQNECQRTSVKELLPLAFSEENLIKKESKE